MSRHLQSQPSLITRVVASFAAALVLALVVFGASPQLHAWLHGPEGAVALKATSATTDGNHDGATQDLPDDDGCAVTLFSHGLVLALAFMVLAFSGQVLRWVDFAWSDVVLPGSPRYLRLPTQAPPARLS